MTARFNKYALLALSGVALMVFIPLAAILDAGGFSQVPLRIQGIMTYALLVGAVCEVLLAFALLVIRRMWLYLLPLAASTAALYRVSLIVS